MPELAYDWKDAAMLASMLIGAAAFLPYLFGMAKRETKPHPYTWLILTLTQGTATAGLFAGGAGYMAYGFLAGTMMSACICLASIRNAREAVAKGDTILLVLAIIAIVIWWQFDHPVAAVFMVSAIDFAAYIPTLRKGWRDPKSESALAWGLFSASYLFAIFALRSYNFLTLPYLVVVLVADALIAVVLIVRRRSARERYTSS
jgi:hypothetical protein